MRCIRTSTPAFVALDAAASDDSLRAVIITGADGIFCAAAT